MRILHTADWHLGHRLHDNERGGEHALFLEWLLHTVENQQIDLLIVAGDIFDTANPTHQALEQYYAFIMNLLRTCCRNVVIIGGNHDSPGTLNAPKDILKHLNIHVIGKAQEDLEEQVIRILDGKARLQGLVCAVPFLRDRDIRRAVAGESYQEIEQRLKEGIIGHYRNLADYIAPYKAESIPVIATGHLFASGGELSDEKEGSEKPIHIGTLGNISAQEFPDEFDYITLGHLHRPQLVSGRTHIRYAGSPIPLSFSEFSDHKSALLIEFDGNQLTGIESLRVPNWRKLIRFRGELDKIIVELTALDAEAEAMPVWVEVKAELQAYDPQFLQKIHEVTKGRNLHVLKHQVIYTDRALAPEELIPEENLRELNPEEVFRRKCESEKFNLNENPDILGAFRELVEEMG